MEFDAALGCWDWRDFFGGGEVGWDISCVYYFAGGGPLGSSLEDFVEAAATHGLDIVTQGGVKNAAFSKSDGHEHGLVSFC